MRTPWDLIRTFEAVARTGSLSAAARTLGITQPTVGRHIDLLEADLKMTLFLRGREGMQLTDKGADLLGIAQEMRASAHGFERKATGLDDAVSGVVRISANEIFGVLLLPRVLAKFMALHPEIQIELVVDNAASNLLQRDADIAVRMFRPTQNDLVARKITDLPLGLYAHRDYLAANDAPASLDALRNHRFIGFDRDPSLIQAAAALGVEFAPDDFAFRCDNILTHIEALRAGVGIGVAHRGLAQKWDDVQPVLPEVPLPALELWIACHAEVHHNKRMRLIMDFLAQELSDPYG